MALLSWPAAIEPHEPHEFRIRRRHEFYSSPFSGTEVIHELPGARWTARLAFDDLEAAAWRDLEGLLSNLDRMTDTVALPDHAWPGNLGVQTGTQLLSGAAESQSVTVTGMTGPLQRGDRFMVGGRLYRVRFLATPVSGTATVGIAPRLRASATSEAIAYANLTCPMRVVDGEQNNPTRKPGPRADFAVEFVEPLP